MYVPNSQNNTSAWNAQCTGQVCFFLPCHSYNGMLQCFLKGHDGLWHMWLLLLKFLCCHLIRLNDYECSPDLVHQFWLEKHLHYIFFQISLFHSRQLDSKFKYIISRELGKRANVRFASPLTTWTENTMFFLLGNWWIKGNYEKVVDALPAYIYLIYD